MPLIHLLWISFSSGPIVSLSGIMIQGVYDVFYIDTYYYPSMSNKFPRATVKIQEDGRGYHRIVIPPWVMDHLRAEKGTLLKPSIWRKGTLIKLQEDAVVFEIVREG